MQIKLLMKYLNKILKLMEIQSKKLNAPIYKKLEIVNKNPFKIFVFAILSPRTKDETLIKILPKFFSKFKDFKDLANANLNEIEDLIKNIGLYKQKAKRLKNAAKEIIEKYNGKIPNKLEEIVKISGIGNKVGKVILNELYNLPYVAVDTHVHRISNRLGIVNTKRVEETEKILEEILPKEIKIKYNRTFVAFGQTVCLPKNPKCNICKIKKFCKYVIFKTIL